MTPLEQARANLVELRNYFGENDKTPAEHRMFSLATSALASLDRSPWIAVETRPKFQTAYWVLLRPIDTWPEENHVVMYWYRGDGFWADAHGDDLNGYTNRITHYAEIVPPIPPKP